MISGLRCEVAAGPGVVGRWGDYAVVAGPDGAPEALAELVGLVEQAAGAGAPGQELSHRLARFITGRPPAELPSFGVLAGGEGVVAVILRGRATLAATVGGAAVSLSGEAKPTWVDEYLRGDVERIELSAGGAVQPGPLPGDLRDGVVPGAGAVLVPARGSATAVDDLPGQAVRPVEDAGPREPAPQGVPPTGEAEPAPEAAAAGDGEQPGDPDAAALPFEAIDLTAPPTGPPRPPLPIAERTTGPPAVPDDPDAVLVAGVLSCDRQHFNHPEARYCAHCGNALVVGHTLEATTRPRPPLGNLVFGDGRMLALDASYVIGRDPRRDPQVEDGSLRGFPLEDPDQVLSRVHVEVRLTDWDVELVDRGSANGTFVRDGDGGEWRRLEPDLPFQLRSGCEARFGSHRFTFDSHIRRA